MDIEAELTVMGARAKDAAYQLAVLDTDTKNAALLAMAVEIEASRAELQTENTRDLAAGEEKGLNAAMLDRLTLDDARINAMAAGIRKVASLPDPVGERLREWKREDELSIEKIRVPIGVIGIIYESRPNVTADAAVLCLKAGNATILRGGSEAIHSNVAIAAALARGAAKVGVPEHSIQLVPFTDRESVGVLARMDKYLDLIIPRGGRGLIEAVISQSRVPVIKHYDGICHVYVDKDADPAMALSIAVNSKCQRPGVCNAAETLLVHADVADKVLPDIAQALTEKGVELRGDDATRAILGENATSAATEEDWRTEYLDLIYSVKVVTDVREAINHINRYGSGHSDAIVSDNEATANSFLAGVDSAAVFWNASTRFSDGEEFGFGAEIGISTDKLHARGPMALEELTSYKYLLRGNGQLRV